MNYPHLHMIINHIPLIAIPTALIFLVHSLWRGIDSTRNIALVMLLLTTVLVLPTKFSGEEAEEVIEEMPAISKQLIHEHEEASEISVILTLLAGGAALVALLTRKKTKFTKYNNWAVLSLSAAAIISLGYTANQGGKIRHPEITSDAATATGEVQNLVVPEDSVNQNYESEDKDMDSDSEDND